MGELCQVQASQTMDKAGTKDHGGNEMSENTTYLGTSIVNQVVESVMDLIDSQDYFAKIRRGALGTEPGLCCEVAPSIVDAVFLDKNSYILLDLTLNGKHSNLQTLSDTLNNITDYLTRLKSYGSGNGWEIVDITAGSPSEATVLEREQNGLWFMASGVIIKFYRKDETT